MLLYILKFVRIYNDVRGGTQQFVPPYFMQKKPGVSQELSWNEE